MLTDLRSVLPAPFTAPDAERGCGNAEDGAGVVGGGNSVLEGVRNPVFGVLFVNDLAGVDGGCKPDGFRVLATGSAGSAMVGGPLEGLLGFGSAVVILKPLKGYLWVAFWLRPTTLRILCCRTTKSVSSAQRTCSPRTERTSLRSAGCLEGGKAQPRQMWNCTRRLCYTKPVGINSA